MNASVAAAVGKAVRRACVLLSALLVFTGSARLLPASAAGVSVGGEKTALLPSAAVPAAAPDCRSAVLMEAGSGRVLYALRPDEPLPPASVTKIMTLLLVCEAMDRGVFGPDTVLTASARAASMGGSQIFLKEGERMKASDLIKSVVIASANDAAVVLAEAVCGSEESFVAAMNARAAELGMKNTHFENTNGLDDTVTRHYSSALDIALMSRELIRHERILAYSSLWMDTVRDGSFGLTNTNRLVRFYPGANGLKTGSTAKALFCVSATAKREGMTLIAVIMGAPTRDARNAAAVSLFDWGFANYAVVSCPGADAGTVGVTGGTAEKIAVRRGGASVLVPRGREGDVTLRLELPQSVPAPVAVGGSVGRAVWELDGELLAESPVTAAENAEKMTFALLWRMLAEKMLAG